MKFKSFTNILSFSLLLLIFSSCLGKNDENENYSEWRTENEAFITKAETETENGALVYEKISPVWDNTVFTLMRWHNDREETANSITPLSNSTIAVKYTLTNISGDTLDYSADFKCKPNQMITGFWTAVTNMHVSDTVTAIIPSGSGYGAYGSGAVLPYSTLIFGIRLDSIISYEKKY